MAKKISKKDEAKIVTETSDAVALMAIEHLTHEDEAALDVLEAVQGEQAEATVSELPATNDVLMANVDGSSWGDVLKSISDADVDNAVLSVAKAFDERMAFEEVHGHPNIQRTLKKARAQMATKRAVRVMLAAGFNEGQINRVKHEGARYNVYALGKLADVIYGVSGGAIANAVNNAITRSLFRFKANGTPFTFELAKAAVSDKIRVEPGMKGMLVRHTVSASTAPTQASSTMQALVDLGIVSSSGGKNPTFALTDAPIVAKLNEVLSAAA